MRVLVLTHRLPYAPNRGDRIRAFHLLRLLATRHEVHLVSLVHDESERAHMPEMERSFASVRGAMVPSRLRSGVAAALALPGRRALTHVMLDSPELTPILNDRAAHVAPDVVLAYCTGMVRHALRSPLADFPCVLDMVDLDSQKWSDLAARTRGPMRWVYEREARILRDFERDSMRRVHATTVVSEREREVAIEAVGSAPLVVPNGVDVDSFARPHPAVESEGVVFCGVFNYGPNEDGAVWLAERVWPLVRRDLPSANLRLVGMLPSQRVRNLARDGSIEVTGAVGDVRPFLWNAAVAVAPLHVARGIQNKVLEAVAAGLPCVVTPAVHAGVPADIAPATICHQDPEGFASSIVSLIKDGAAARAAMVARASLARQSWAYQLAPFLSLLEEARAGAACAS